MANSRVVTSSQTGIHERLEEVVRRNLEHPFKKPIAEHTQAAFDRASVVPGATKAADF